MNVDRPMGMIKAMAAVALAGCFAASVAIAQNTDLATKTGNNVGVTLTGYKYDEPGTMTLKATKVGLDYTGTYAIGSQWPNRNEGWFLRTDVRFATGKADYSSPISGTLNDREDWYYEVRGLVGKDFDMGSYVLAPYIGVGFRHLYNDLRGITTTFARGYRRESNYTTLPIGVTHKMNLSGGSQLHTTVEYMHLIKGQQKSKLTDSNPLTPDVSLNQGSGYGLRLSSMMRFDTWSVGPTLTYWNISQSDFGGIPLVFEPKNKTYEFGIKAAYHF